MTNQQHPITPPEDLLQKLGKLSSWREIITKAYQAGADQELEACGRWLAVESIEASQDLRTARRPKPPSLKKQAYDALDTYIYGEPDPKDKERTYNTIRRALEALDD